MAIEGSPRRCCSWLNTACKQSPINNNYDALPSSVCIHSRYELSQRFCSVTVCGMCDADNIDGTGPTGMTENTPFQYRNAFFQEILWLEWLESMISMIMEMSGTFQCSFLVLVLIWSWWTYTHVWIFCIEYSILIRHMHLNGLYIYVTRYWICPVRYITIAWYIRTYNIVEGGSYQKTRSIFTLSPIWRCFFTNFQHIIFSHAPFTIDHHASQGGELHFIFFWMWKPDQSQSSWHYTKGIRFYSQLPSPKLRETHWIRNHCRGKHLGGTLHVQVLYKGVARMVTTWKGTM